MPKLTDDPKVAAAIEKAELKGAKTERSRINQILRDATASAADLEDSGHKKVVKQALKGVKDEISAGA